MAQANLSEFGKTTPGGGTATGTTSAALAANINRKPGTTLVNLDTTNFLFAAAGVPAVSGQGWALAPNGGTLNLDANMFTKSAINVITAGSSIAYATSEAT